MKTLASEGHTTFVVCPISARGLAEKENNVYTLGPIKPVNSYPSYGIVGQPTIAMRKVKSILKKEKPDIIHSNTPLTIGLTALYASKTLGIPLVGSLHTLLPEMVKYYPPLKLKMISEILGWQIYNHYYNLCNCVTCPTPATRRILLKKGIRRNIITIPNGVDVDRFKPSESAGELFRESQSISNSSKVILFSGRLSFEKRVDLLIKAFKKLLRYMPEALLLILGDGPQKGDLIALAERFNIQKQVLFLGRIEHDDKLIPAIYNATDVFVLPSAFETQGLSVLEAMACGKTVIATSVGGVVDLIRNKYSGLLVRFNDVEELTNALKNILIDDQTRQQIGEVARRTAQAYSIAVTTHKLISMYESLTSEDTTEIGTLTDIPHALLYLSAFFSTFALFYVFQTLQMI